MQIFSFIPQDYFLQHNLQISPKNTLFFNFFNQKLVASENTYYVHSLANDHIMRPVKDNLIFVYNRKLSGHSLFDLICKWDYILDKGYRKANIKILQGFPMMKKNDYWFLTKIEDGYDFKVVLLLYLPSI